VIARNTSAASEINLCTVITNTLIGFPKWLNHNPVRIINTKNIPAIKNLVSIEAPVTNIV
jgi:hypothetical protein